MSNSRLKESNIEWLGKIPKNWKLMHNKYLLKKKKSIISKYNNEKILSLTMNGVIERDLTAGGKMPSSFNGYQKLEKGNLLLCLFDIDVTPRCVGIIPTNGITSPAYSQFILNKGKANLKYYYYYFLMLDNQKTLVHLSKNLRNTLSEQEFGNLISLCPPLKEQKQIADFLDKKVSQIDDISKKIQQEITDLEEYRKSIITKAVTKGIDKNVPIKNSGDKMIGEIAASFKLVPLKYVANYNLHTLSDDTNPDFCFKYIDICSVTTGHINKYQKLRFADAPSRARRLVKNNDIIISTVRTYLKAIAFIQDLQKTTVVSTGFIVLSPKKNLIDPVYLRYAIENESFISKVQAYSVGITYPAINSSTIMNFKLVYPPFNAQKEIASYLDKKCKSINQIIEKKRTLINSLNQYKQSIIYEYVTGKKPVPTEEGVQE